MITEAGAFELGKEYEIKLFEEDKKSMHDMLDIAQKYEEHIYQIKDLPEDYKEHVENCINAGEKCN